MLLAQVLVTPTMGPHNPFNPFGGQEVIDVIFNLSDDINSTIYVSGI